MRPIQLNAADEITKSKCVCFSPDCGYKWIMVWTPIQHLTLLLHEEPLYTLIHSHAYTLITLHTTTINEDTLIPYDLILVALIYWYVLRFRSSFFMVPQHSYKCVKAFPIQLIHELIHFFFALRLRRVCRRTVFLGWQAIQCICLRNAFNLCTHYTLLERPYVMIAKCRSSYSLRLICGLWVG